MNSNISERSSKSTTVVTGEPPINDAVELEEFHFKTRRRIILTMLVCALLAAFLEFGYSGLLFSVKKKPSAIIWIVFPSISLILLSLALFCTQSSSIEEIEKKNGWLVSYLSYTVILLFFSFISGIVELGLFISVTSTKEKCTTGSLESSHLPSCHQIDIAIALTVLITALSPILFGLTLYYGLKLYHSRPSVESDHTLLLERMNRELSTSSRETHHSYSGLTESTS